MSKKRIVSLLSFMSFILLITVNAYCQYQYYPTPQQCTICHGIDTIYQEWNASKHAKTINDNINAICFKCHVPGCHQDNLLKEGEKPGYQVLGYIVDDKGDTDNTNDTWARLEPKELCKRCHDDIPNANHKGEGNCIDCHMPVDGLTTYRVHAKKPITFGAIKDDGSFDPMKNNIAKYVTREHRIHTFLKPVIPESHASIGTGGIDTNKSDSHSNCFIKAIGFDVK